MPMAWTTSSIWRVLGHLEQHKTSSSTMQYTKSYMNAFVQECLWTAPPTAAKIGPGSKPVDQHGIECLHDSGVWLLKLLGEFLKVNFCPLL